MTAARAPLVALAGAATIAALLLVAGPASAAHTASETISPTTTTATGDVHFNVAVTNEGPSGAANVNHVRFTAPAGYDVQGSPGSDGAADAAPTGWTVVAADTIVTADGRDQIGYSTVSPTAAIKPGDPALVFPIHVKAFDASVSADGTASTWDVATFDDAPLNAGSTHGTLTTTTDLHKPTIALAQACGTALVNGWCNTQVNVTLAVADDRSTGAQLHVECKMVGNVVPCAPTMSFASVGAKDLFVNATDEAGNVADVAFVVWKLDTTKPFVTATKTPDPNAAGWNRGDVTVSWTCNDSPSGVATPPAPVTLTADGASVIATGHCIDNAGNDKVDTQTAKIDKTPPSACTGTYSGTAGGTHGWYKTTGNEALAGVDATSGAATIQYALDGGALTTYSAPFAIGEGVHTVACTVADNAGNSATFTLTVKIDSVAPTSCTGVFSGTAGENGWYRSGGMENLTGADAASGAAGFTYVLDGGATTAYSGNFSIATGSPGHTLSCTVIDDAGNSATFTLAPIKIDLAAPTVALAPTCATAGTEGWCRGAVSTGVTAADTGGSEVATTACELDGAAISCNAISVPTAGAHRLYVNVTDHAGNAGGGSTTFKIDPTPPTIAFAAITPAPTDDGWNKDDVTVSWTCADAGGSGPLQATVSASVTGSGADLKATGTCTDHAGNAQSGERGGVKIDRALPTATATATCSTAPVNGWCVGSFALSAAGSDAESGLKSLACDVDGVAVACSGATETRAGNRTFHATSTDKAGNVKVASAALPIDILGPALSVSSAPATPDGSAGWFRTAPRVTLAAADPESGLDAILYCVDVADACTPSVPYGGAFLLPDGSSHVRALARDRAGNTAPTAPLSTLYKVDATRPTLSLDASPAAPDGIDGWYVTPPAIRILASDVKSGVGSVAWSLDGGATTTSGDMPVVPAGESTVTAIVRDVAGNVARSDLHLKIDLTPPTVALPSGDLDVGRNTRDLRFSAPMDTVGSVISLPKDWGGSWTDARTFTITTPDLPRARSFEVVLGGGAWRDSHGAPGAYVSYRLRTPDAAPDATPPPPSGGGGVAPPPPPDPTPAAPPDVSIGISPAPNAAGYHQAPPTVALTARAGAAIRYAFDGGSDVDYAAPFVVPAGRHTISYSATDAAGAGPRHAVQILVDATPPTLLDARVDPDTRDLAESATPTFTTTIRADDALSGIALIRVTLLAADGSPIVTVDAEQGVAALTPHVRLEPGAYATRILLRDGAGNEATAAGPTVTLTRTVPPTPEMPTPTPTPSSTTPTPSTSTTPPTNATVGSTPTPGVGVVAVLSMMALAFALRRRA